MDEPGSAPSSEGDSLERLIALLGPRLDEARSLFDDATSRWRGDAVRVGEGTKQRLQSLHATWASSRATNGTSWSFAWPRSSTACTCSKTPNARKGDAERPLPLLLWTYGARMVVLP
jgi:hypothetical protein